MLLKDFQIYQNYLCSWLRKLTSKSQDNLISKKYKFLLNGSLNFSYISCFFFIFNILQMSIWYYNCRDNSNLYYFENKEIEKLWIPLSFWAFSFWACLKTSSLCLLNISLAPLFVESTGGEGRLRDPFGVRASVRLSVMP